MLLSSLVLRPPITFLEGQVGQKHSNGDAELRIARVCVDSHTRTLAADTRTPT